MLIICWAWPSLRVTIGQPRFAAAVICVALTAVLCGHPSKSACAEDRYDRNALFDRKRTVDGDLLAKTKGSNHEHLREGTRIPPSVGQIVMLGRRWAFVPATKNVETPDDLAQRQPRRPPTNANPYNTPRRPTGFGSPALRSGQGLPAAATLVGKDAIFDRDVGDEIPHIILTENLMLQRIIEAIRADASDDRWMVSGQVTEFFSENRLTILTAQRANAN